MKSVACSLLAVASLFASVSAQGSCSSDGNADGVVNVTDLLGLLAQFGGAGSYDTDGDGDVDVTDLLALLAQFGTTGCTSGGGGGGGGGTFSVTGREDGGEETVSTGTMYIGSSDYEIMADGSEQVVGIRFPDVAVSPGASIASAYVLFKVDEVNSGQSDQPCTVNIYGAIGEEASEIWNPVAICPIIAISCAS
jgi:hypothetical protein